MRASGPCGAPVEISEEKRVGDEPRLVAHDDRLLAEPPSQLHHVGNDLFVGDHRPDHLDERDHRRRVEEVQTDHAARVGGRDGDLGDRERGGVRREERVRADAPVQRREDLLLEVQVLGHRFDDQPTTGDGLERRCVRDPPVQRGGLGLGELSPGDRPASGVLERLPAARDAGLVHVDADDGQPGSGEHLDDARTHRAESDDADADDFSSHAPGCQPMLLAGRERGRDGGHTRAGRR
jgi:hypothetical protein